MFTFYRSFRDVHAKPIFTHGSHCRPPKVSKPPTAKPFFDRSSVVLDFYKGHLSAMIERIRQADFSFVMYYAPWDAESQALRQEFESVAQFYHSQV